MCKSENICTNIYYYNGNCLSYCGILLIMNVVKFEGMYVKVYPIKD